MKRTTKETKPRGETAYQEMRRKRVEVLGPSLKDRASAEYAEEIREARRLEKNRRYQESRRRAMMVLAARHNIEYLEILAEEVKGLNRERGPLPGDKRLGRPPKAK